MIQFGKSQLYKDTKPSYILTNKLGYQHLDLLTNLVPCFFFIPEKGEAVE